MLVVLIAFSAVIFHQTRDLTSAAPGQPAAATFPRLAASVLGLLAALKLGLTLARRTLLEGDYDWHWRIVHKPLIAIGLMLGYYWLFKSVPFDVLNAALLGALFVLFAVRPLWWALASAAGATLLVHLLFVRVLQIPV